MESDNESTLEVPSGYTKYDYQMDAVIEGYQKPYAMTGFSLRTLSVSEKQLWQQ